MKRPLLIIVAIIFTVTTIVHIVHGQSSKGKTRASRTRRSAPPKPRRTKVEMPVSAATTTASGLTYVITRHSEGRMPVPGETVMVHYTGLLTNGVKFDSSHDRGEPYTFVLGRGRVIGGWDEAIARLRVGEQATLIIPPQLGYGPEGSGGIIPPNATLVFVVELVGIKEAPGSR